MPVKHQYVRKFKTFNSQHVKITAQLNGAIKNNFLSYISNYFNNKTVGFLQRYVSYNVSISKYQYNVKAIQQELYKDHNALLHKQYAQKKENELKMLERQKRALALRKAKQMCKNKNKSNNGFER